MLENSTKSDDDLCKIAVAPAKVAPYAGAWIETLCVISVPYPSIQSLPTRERGLKQHITGALAAGLVAPYAGAWIETLILPEKPRVQGVAPYAGAWIETVISSSSV